VAAGVEGVVVDPLRLVDAERHGRELLHITPRAPEAPGDVGEDVFVVAPPTALGLGERRSPADVHVRARRLHVEERRVERRQS
jgi:hypothetical protein